MPPREKSRPSEASAGHSPNLRTLMMVERAILDAKSYPTKKELWTQLPRRIEYPTFRRILEYLEASGKIVFNSRSVVYTGANNKKLRKLLETSVALG